MTPAANQIWNKLYSQILRELQDKVYLQVGVHVQKQVWRQIQGPLDHSVRHHSYGQLREQDRSGDLVAN